MAIGLGTPPQREKLQRIDATGNVVRGVLLMPASCMDEPDKMIRLWIHEVYRVFNDRLIDDADRSAYELSLSLSLSLRFNGHFPGEPGLAGVY